MDMPNKNTSANDLRDQLREAKLGYMKLAGEVNRLAWELAVAQQRVEDLEKQLAIRAA